MVRRPSWLKVCQWQAYIPQTSDMILGMYFPREHFEQLRDDPRIKGPHGGVVWLCKRTQLPGQHNVRPVGRERPH